MEAGARVTGWLADLLRESDAALWRRALERDEPLSVDAGHYMAGFSRQIAELIAGLVASFVGCGAG